MTGRMGLFCQFEGGVNLGVEDCEGVWKCLPCFSPSSISLPSRNLFFSSSAISDVGVRKGVIFEKEMLERVRGSRVARKGMPTVETGRERENQRKRKKSTSR